MKVLINKDGIDLGTGENPTFGNVIEKAEKFASEHGKIITHITYNGELVTPDEEASRKTSECKNTDEINMLMDSPRSIITKALMEADNDIPAIVESLKKISTYLQTGARQAAFSLFSECIEQWKQVINLFRIVESVLGFDTKEVFIEGKTLDQVQSELLALLVETRQSMKDDDAIVLSDLLEYELAPSIEQQRDVIKQLISLAKEDPQ